MFGFCKRKYVVHDITEFGSEVEFQKSLLIRGEIVVAKGNMTSQRTMISDLLRVDRAINIFYWETTITSAELFQLEDCVPCDTFLRLNQNFGPRVQRKCSISRRDKTCLNRKWYVCRIHTMKNLRNRFLRFLRVKRNQYRNQMEKEHQKEFID
ncbi:hypothetical protein YC2023_113281 [Brassica napus]